MNDEDTTTPQDLAERVAGGIVLAHQHLNEFLSRLGTLVDDAPSIGGDAIILNRVLLRNQIILASSRLCYELQQQAWAVRERLTERQARANPIEGGVVVPGDPNAPLPQAPPTGSAVTR